MEPAEAQNNMLDAIFLLGTVSFFVLALAYVRGCEQL